MRLHVLEFDSGETTCAKFEQDKDPVMCPLAGSTRFGTCFVCRRFPSDDRSFTLLEEKDGCLQRCPACLEAEKPNLE